jgi:phosphoribosylformylglycinamidine synthase PurS subunit
VKYRFEVVVMLKEGLLDPQGKAVENAIQSLGVSNVSDVRVGKNIQLTVEASDEADHRDVIADVVADVLHPLAEKVLSNPVIERFSVRPLREDPR